MSTAPYPGRVNALIWVVIRDFSENGHALLLGALGLDGVGQLGGHGVHDWIRSWGQCYQFIFFSSYNTLASLTQNVALQEKIILFQALKLTFFA
jgi:hypothetical protein